MSWKFNKMLGKNIPYVGKACGHLKIRGIEIYV